LHSIDVVLNQPANDPRDHPGRREQRDGDRNAGVGGLP
jgi:hypothetical protein